MKRRDFVRNTILLSSAYAASRCGIDTESGPKVVLLGFDGANWPTINPLIKEGKLPYLQQLIKNSAWADFKTCKPTKSNVVWSSIASGKTMIKHGIMDFAFLKKSGMKVPYSKSERKAPMVWQILDELGHRSVVVNWWVSHPPDPINGVMISDFFRVLFSFKSNEMYKVSDSIHPKTYFNLLRRMVKRNIYNEILGRTGLPDFPGLFQQYYPQGNIKKTVTLKHYPGFVHEEDLIERISWYLFNKENFDFFATYFRMPDVSQHFITHLMDYEFRVKLKSVFKNKTINDALINDAVLRVSKLMEPVYRYMETIIKKYMTNEKYKNTYFFILSDHGFSFYPGGYNHYGLPKGYNAPDGILMIHGPQIKPGKIDHAGIFDIVPTILYALNYPVGKNMDGRVMKEIFKFNRKIKYRTYKLKKKDEANRDALYDEETLKGLRSLGYIDSDS